jgi:hypothetical protein
MYDDDPSDPDYLLHRRKSCPCCRADVKHRPVPVFLVKSIATAVMRAKGSNPARSVTPLPDSDVDVWAGLFPEIKEGLDEADDEDEGYPYDEDDEDDEDSDDEDIEPEEDEDDEDDDDTFSYGDSYTGRYVPARWEPESLRIDPGDVPALIGDDIDPDMYFAMLRRGATPSMIERYSMYYTHSEGLVATHANGVIHLGWNVELSADDPDGENYMAWILDDVFERPDRWDFFTLDDTSSFVAKMLVREDYSHDYSTDDSEE